MTAGMEVSQMPSLHLEVNRQTKPTRNETVSIRPPSAMAAKNASSSGPGPQARKPGYAILIISTRESVNFTGSYCRKQRMRKPVIRKLSDFI